MNDKQTAMMQWDRPSDYVASLPPDASVEDLALAALADLAEDYRRAARPYLRILADIEAMNPPEPIYILGGTGTFPPWMVVEIKDAAK